MCAAYGLLIQTDFFVKKEFQKKLIVNMLVEMPYEEKLGMILTST